MNMGNQQTKFDKANRMASLLVDHATGKTAETSEYELLRQELLADLEVAALMPLFVRENRNLSSFWNFIKHKFPTYAERRTYLSKEFTPLLDFLEFGAPSSLISGNAPAGPQIINARATKVDAVITKDLTIARNKRKVFIVHGRDNEVKQVVARFIETMGLQSIILHEQASTGMTIIEKIERYSGDADFALVLYTPCDLGRGNHENNAPAKSRARQNVVFEHGYLMARYGRENVCALVKGQIETPNDISGVVYVDFDDQGSWKAEVAKELKACGYKIKPWF
jgi:predicted nucleotide-binding protein